MTYAVFDFASIAAYVNRKPQPELKVATSTSLDLGPPVIDYSFQVPMYAHPVVGDHSHSHCLSLASSIHWAEVAETANLTFWVMTSQGPVKFGNVG